MVQLEADRSRSTSGVAAVDRALSILAAIAAEPEPRTLAELAAATNLYKSTILRLLESLEAAGYVLRLRDGRYTLAVMAFRLGAAYERTNPLRQHVLPVLTDLVNGGSESASFHVRQGRDKRVCLFRVDSKHSTLDRVRAGDVFPLDRGAAGRILRAFDGASGELNDRIRAEYFAVSIGEREPGCAGMAAPVFAAEGALRGALSLSGPEARFTEAMISEFRPKLITAAAEITRSLGGRYPAIS